MEELLKQFPELAGIDPDKLRFIQEFAGQAKPKTSKEAVPFLLAAASRAQKNNIRFTQAEISLISELLMQQMQPDEKARAKKMLSLFNRINPQGPT